MSRKVVFPFRHQASLVCPEAKKMLTDAGFDLVCNETGVKLSDEAQHELIKDAYAIVAGTERYDERMLSGCDNLRTIIRFGVGTDNFDLDTLKKKGIHVGTIANHNAVAEFTLTLILSTMKNLPLYDTEVRSGGWGRYRMKELSGKTVGIIGFGRIGKRLAGLLSGFGCTIIAYDPYPDMEAAASLDTQFVPLDELLSRSDVISLHIPLNDKTRHIINADTISRMKDGVYFVNTSRGGLVDEAALVEALKSGKIAGAGLDVFEKEPVTPDNPLFDLDNDVLAPHVSALSIETNYNAGIISAQSIINVLNGGKPIYPVF